MAADPSQRPDEGFLRGLTYPLRGARFVYVQHRGLARLWVPPLAIVAVLLVVVTWLALDHRAALFEALWASPQGDGWLDQALRGLHWLAAFLFGGLLVLAGAAAVLLGSGVIAAPWNDALSAAVERIAAGASPEASSSAQLVRDALRSLGFAAALLGGYLTCMAVLLLLGWLIPVAGPVLNAVLGFLVTAFFLALENADLAAARHGLSVRERFAHVRRHMPSALGMGTAIWVLMLVPLLNLLLMPAAVAGATLWFLDTRRALRTGGSDP
jgi:CysZ protein